MSDREDEARGGNPLTVLLILSLVGVSLAVLLYPEQGRFRFEASQQAHAGAIDGVRRILIAQSLAREGRGPYHYRTVKELAAQGLLTGALATGTRGGYVFTTGPGSAREFTCWIQARRISGPGYLHFVCNQQGLIYQGHTPPPADDGSCAIPKDGFTAIKTEPAPR